MEIKWHDIDPNSDERRFLRAVRFAGEWTFSYKYQRRGEWSKWWNPTRDMWEHVVDSLERRYWRREGVELSDIKQAKEMLAKAILDEERRNMPDNVVKQQTLEPEA